MKRITECSINNLLRKDETTVKNQKPNNNDTITLRLETTGKNRLQYETRLRNHI